MAAGREVCLGGLGRQSCPSAAVLVLQVRCTGSDGGWVGRGWGLSSRSAEDQTWDTLAQMEEGPEGWSSRGAGGEGWHALAELRENFHGASLHCAV